MISSNDFKTGMTIELDGDVYQIVEFQHVKPGKGAAFVRTKIRNVKSGGVIEKKFNAGERVSPARLDRREMQYLYKEEDGLYVMMDNENYEQRTLTDMQIGESVKWLKENMNLGVLLYNNDVIGVDMPTTVHLRVAETEPGIKGDTATGGTKAAVMETGASVQVPFFINEGDMLIIDTRTGSYVSRA
ncbi:MAG: elongation factor P [Peptococcaceae bacterium]|nr:elongation factor P [Peptococcaceae bacterium]